MRVPLSHIAIVAGLLGLACNSNMDPVFVTLPQAPSSLESVSLNRAIELYWADNAYTSAPDRFMWYRVYSATYDLDHGLCGTHWDLEGTTISPEFLVGALTNGEPRCYGVAAVSTDGTEGPRSPLRQDTPRPDARNVVVYAYGTRPDSSGFRFWDDVNNDASAQAQELGLIQNGHDPSVDFAIHRNSADSSLWIVPVYSGTTMLEYGIVGDLTGVDYAPETGYRADSLRAYPGDSYVFQIVDGSDLHYGAIRVTHVGRQYLILDWSVQTDPGNPELQPRPGLAAPRQGSFIAAK
jgi:hypothetical protein